MKRACMPFLINWLKTDRHQPLVIRGARQVGKTWLVRHLAEVQQRQLIEINFEKKPQLVSLFSSNEPREILLNLGAAFNQTINPMTHLLFLDEIQAEPQLLAKLRWFAEDLPELPVIAAGSLLEFVLEEHTFSMPVGRIQYMHLEPLSFEEFLLASDEKVLVDYLKEYALSKNIPQVIHEKFMKHFKEYILIGGMPAAVASWISKRSLEDVNRIHHDLMATYRDDLAKYSTRIDTMRLDEVMLAVPKFLGEKFIYTRISPELKISTIKHSLDLLYKAKICHKVTSTSANGIPLASEVHDKFFKVIFLDVGLCSAALGLSMDRIHVTEEVILINNGGIAEQVVGQLLRTICPLYIDPALYYWLRQEKNASAEVDYVIPHHSQVIPIEVKAGRTGGLKSLHVFMQMKQLQMAVRFNSDLPSLTDIAVKDHLGNPVQYKLLSLPFYLLGQLHRLLED